MRQELNASRNRLPSVALWLAVPVAALALPMAGGIAPALAATDGMTLVAQNAASLPGEQAPDSLSESFGEWTVSCVRSGEGRAEAVIDKVATDKADMHCAMAQERFETGSKGQIQRIMTVVIEAKDGAAAAPVMRLLLPFGLVVSQEVQVKLGEQLLARGRFSTCAPEGCMVSVVLDNRAIGLLSRDEDMRFAVFAAPTTSAGQRGGAAALQASAAAAAGGEARRFASGDRPDVMVVARMIRNGALVNIGLSRKGFGAAFARLGALASGLK